MLEDARTRADCQRKVFGFVHAHLRRFAAQLLQALMEHERDEFLRCAPYQRTPRRRGYRNGYRCRWFDTRWGPVPLRRPKVRGTGEPFRSKVLARYKRREQPNRPMGRLGERICFSNACVR